VPVRLREPPACAQWILRHRRGLGVRGELTIGTEDVEVAPGSWAYVPRSTRRGFTASADARALILVTPAGLEGFSAELGGRLAAGTPTQELRAALKGRVDSVPA
jgi:hypothetical protein